MAEKEELRPEPQPAPTHYPEEKKEEKTLEEQMEEIKSWNLDTSHERPPIDAEPVQKTVLPEIEMLEAPFKLWSEFCDHESASMEAIGGFITDQAEEVAYDDDPDSILKGIKREFCKGIIGDDDITFFTLFGAAVAGGGNFIRHGWNGIWTIAGHPYKTTASVGLGLGYAATHGKEVVEGIADCFEEFENMNLNEKLTVGVEVACDVALAYKSAKELLNAAKAAKNAKKLKAAGALETGGAEGAEAAGIAEGTETVGAAEEDASVGGKIRIESGSNFKGQIYKGARNSEIDFINGKGKSTLTKHAGKHGYVFPEEYLKDARNFLEKQPTSATQSFVSGEGTYFRYDTTTNEFGIINQYGGISTYFKLEEGMAYWLEQIEKYAPK